MADENVDPNTIINSQNDDETLAEEEKLIEKYDLLDAPQHEEFRQEVLDVFEIFNKEQDDTCEVGALATILRWLKFNPTDGELKTYAKTFDRHMSGKLPLSAVLNVVNKRLAQPDTIDELVEAMKLFDHDNDGKVTVPEFRWAMTKLGETPFDEKELDDLLKEVDKDNTGFVDVMAFAKTSFGIKEDKPKEETKAPAKKKK